MSFNAAAWPADCPHDDAPFAAGEVVYRIVKSNPPQPTDFLTAHESRTYLKRDACLRRGLSVYRRLADAVATQQAFPQLGNYIAMGTLEHQHGKLKQTGRPSHHTWWPCDDADRLSAFAVV